MPSVIESTGAYMSHKLILDTYKYDLSYLAPIDRLPPELLEQIFIPVQGPGDEFSPVVLSHVCKHWRSIVWGYPRLWQCLHLCESRDMEASHALAHLWLKRSWPLQFDVDVTIVAKLDLLFPLLSPLVPHVRRWRKIAISGKRTEDIACPPYQYYGDIRDTVNYLRLSVMGESESRGVGNHVVQASPSSSHYTPTVEFHGEFTVMNITVNTLPLSQLISPVYITRLSITECSVDVTTDPVRLLNLLAACPHLVMVDYKGWPHEGDPVPCDERPQVVSLLHLESLELRSTCAVRMLLSFIHAPELIELRLGHTNVDFELQHPEAFSHEFEDGDSDDEAHDFSQSPWSDHATGMGLRALIKRSDPPIRVLNMDYADMRTKDFLWCFDRLEDLEEFRIIASDMSSKVIDMLAPFSALDAHDDAVAGVEGDSAMQVRLPRLTVLDLCNCQQLPGNAVVSVLRARERFADQVADDEICSQLKEVTIEGCADFLPHHAMELAAVFGERLRVD